MGVLHENTNCNFLSVNFLHFQILKTKKLKLYYWKKQMNKKLDRAGQTMRHEIPGIAAGSKMVSGEIENVTTEASSTTTVGAVTPSKLR